MRAAACMASVSTARSSSRITNSSPPSRASVSCVRRTAALYMEVFELKRVFCEPNAFNVAPNRTLQKAGFRYVKTHMTVPGPLNYHQAVTRWVLEM